MRQHVAVLNDLVRASWRQVIVVAQVFGVAAMLACASEGNESCASECSTSSSGGTSTESCVECSSTEDSESESGQTSSSETTSVSPEAMRGLILHDGNRLVMYRDPQGHVYGWGQFGGPLLEDNPSTVVVATELGLGYEVPGHICQEAGEDDRYLCVSEPVEIPELFGATWLNLRPYGMGGGCATMADGRFLCWSWTAGVPHVTMAEFYPRPTEVEWMRGRSFISGDLMAGCMRTADGAFDCVGTNFFARNGLGTADPEALSGPPMHPLGVPRGRDIALQSGSLNLYAAIDEIGEVYAWGSPYWGQLGKAEVVTTETCLDLGAPCLSTPMLVEGSSKALELTLTVYAGFAIREDGTVLAWGQNGRGLLAQGDVELREGAHVIPGLNDVVELAPNRAGGMCALTSQGDVYCWGTVPGSLVLFEDPDSSDPGCSPKACYSTPHKLGLKVKVNKLHGTTRTDGFCMYFDAPDGSEKIFCGGVRYSYNVFGCGVGNITCELSEIVPEENLMRAQVRGRGNDAVNDMLQVGEADQKH